jgi:hypothetical protein
VSATGWEIDSHHKHDRSGCLASHAGHTNDGAKCTSCSMVDRSNVGVDWHFRETLARMVSTGCYDRSAIGVAGCDTSNVWPAIRC